MEIIKFDNFSFKYRTQKNATLKNINLTINKGEKILIVGPSGCGKSTLANCLNGIIPYSIKGDYQGELSLNGHLFTKSSIHQLSKNIGTVLQDTDGQFVGLSVAEDIAFSLENDMIDIKEMKERVLKVSKMVNMDHLLKSSPQSLSGGQKQRVSLAGVLVDDVEILLFDEPLANLDPLTGKKAIELIDDIHHEDKTIVIIEHRLEDVLHRNVDRIIVMIDGSIVIDDKPDVVLSSNILIENGIREPLYLQACKYAGIEIKPDMKPSSRSNFNLNGKEEQLKKWFMNNKLNPQQQVKKPVLEVSNLSFSYNYERQILCDLNFYVNKNEMIAIIGKNGAGKSTLAKLIVGFEKLKKGQIIANGLDLSNLSIKERADNVGIVLQNPNHMISQNLIFDEIALGLRNRGLNETIIKDKVLNIMKVCGLERYEKWPISALSYGQKKRVTIASILVLDPSILILDEPTAGQDFKHYSEIMNFLTKLKMRGITIIIITHDMHLMLEYCQRAIVIADQKILMDDYAYKTLINDSIIEKANLKKTSLFTLASKYNLDPDQFINTFIEYERSLRNDA